METFGAASLRGGGSAGYVEVAKEFDVPATALHTAAYKLRKRLKTLIREEVRETVASPPGLRGRAETVHRPVRSSTPFVRRVIGALR